MEPARTFDHIWYRDRPATESTRSDPFTRERGRLVVEGDGLRFEGKTTSLVMRDIAAVEYGVHGTMTSPSIHVRYREGDGARSAWFTDGGMGGYAGMFGGTRRLAGALSHLGPATFDDGRGQGAASARLHPYRHRAGRARAGAARALLSGSRSSSSIFAHPLPLPLSLSLSLRVPALPPTCAHSACSTVVGVHGAPSWSARSRRAAAYFA